MRQKCPVITSFMKLITDEYTGSNLYKHIFNKYSLSLLQTYYITLFCVVNSLLQHSFLKNLDKEQEF